MRLLLILTLLNFPFSVSAHELWIEPVDFTVEAEGKFQANIVNGQNFVGVKLPYLERSIEFFSIFNGDSAEPVQSRIGSRPAVDMESLDSGLNVFAYQSTPSSLTYTEPEKFTAFVEHKDLAFGLADHLERGLGADRITEVYTRYSKSLVGAGDALGSDRRVGFETEIVALGNPYTDNSDTLGIQLFYRETPRSNEQVEVFERAADGTVVVTLTRTDADGVAVIPVKRNHSYMLDAVVIREPNDEIANEYNAMWETLWANLTFYVPQ